jgi:hypothetical protein
MEKEITFEEGRDGKCAFACGCELENMDGTGCSFSTYLLELDFCKI